jgi:hypothetical protein
MRRAVASLAAASLFAVSTAAAQGGAASITDPRVGLHTGFDDAGTAAKNMRLIAHRGKPDTLDGAGGSRGLTYANSDLAFEGNYVFQGNFSGFSIWDISNPAMPALRAAEFCTTGQGDPSVIGNLLFISSEGTGDRTDCSNAGVKEKVSADRMVGVRIFDISDIDHPRKVFDVQTCRGSHTHTVVPDPKSKSDVFIYVSGMAGVRSPEELAGCNDWPIDSLNSARFRIDIIKVPLAHPEDSKVVGAGHIFADMNAAHSHGTLPGDTLERRARAGRGGRGGAAGRTVNLAQLPAAMVSPVIDSIEKARGGTGAPTAADSQATMQALMARFAKGGGEGRGAPNQCHDITVYPAVGLAGAACGGYGLLLDIKDPLNPKRLDFAGDTNFAFWHSATFSNDGTKLLFTDEWGGGTQARCREIDPLDWGGDAVFTLADGKMTQHGYFKMPAAQTEQENCVAHNGSLVPVPGRNIMVQGWYQGGVDVFDFTDPDHVHEIAYFDRGPIPNDPSSPDSQSTRIVTGGYWCGYWYNGHIYASEIARGFDVFDLEPSEWLSQNEIDAAKLIHMDTFNPQSQTKLVWPAAFPVVKSYLDQLNRDNGLPLNGRQEAAREIASAERSKGAARAATLTKLAAQLDADAKTASDAQRVGWMAQAARDLAHASK